jgi:AraC family transcriptional regulator
MPNIDLMLKAIEFIESHLTDDITVADMAESVSFSLFHFSRVFSRVTRHSPHEYLMRRRFCEAARCLMTSDEKIIDIAFRYQFKAPETFSRAFKRVFYLQPRQVKSGTMLDKRRLMGEVTQEYLEFINSGISLKPAAINRTPMKIAGIAALINAHDPNSQIKGIWNLLGREVNEGKLVPADREYFGVRMFFTTKSSDQFNYLAGFPLLEDESPPHLFVQKDIPGMDYACFKLPEDSYAASFTRKYVYHSWWPKVTNAPLADFEIEFFPHQFECSTPVPKSLCFPLTSNSFSLVGS